MIVCHCTGATDRDIRKAAQMAGPGATFLCAAPAGQCCGGCTDKVREIANQALSAKGVDEVGQVARR